MKGFFFNKFPILKKWRENEKIKQIAANSGWLSIDRLVTMVTGFFIAALLARYLGPDRYGLLNYALSFVGLLAPFARLGLKDIAVRNIVRDPEEKNEILGTTFVLRVIGSILGIAIVLVLVIYFRGFDTLVLLLTAVISVKLVFLSFETIDYWFQSQVESKYTVWSRRGAYFCVALVKIIMVLLDAPLIAFAWAILAEAGLAALLRLAFYIKKQYSIFRWSVAWNRIRELLRDSWPLIISNLAIAIYMKVDRIMLGQMVGDSAVGVYSVAAKVSEVWYFIPTAIAASVFPALIKTKEGAEHLYGERMQLLYDTLALLSYGVALPLSLLAGPLINIVFGPEYSQAATILTVHVWAFVFVSIGVARSRWLIMEDLQFYLMIFTLFGSLTNVGLNIYLIPIYGGLGAAWATVLAQLVAAYLSSLLFKRFWSVFKKETKALLLPFRFKSYYNSLKSLVD